MNRNEVLSKAWSFGAGGMVESELAYLYDHCWGRDVLEIGSMIGQSSFVLAYAAKSLTCVDAWIDGCPFLEPRQAECYTVSDMEQVFDRNMAGLKFRKIKAMSADARAVLKRQRFDVVLIDADHEFKAVARDIHRFLPLLRRPGLLLLHDYRSAAWPGVMRAANKMLAEYTPEVIHALGVFRI